MKRSLSNFAFHGLIGRYSAIADAEDGHESLELPAEVGFERGAVGDVFPILVIELLERSDEAIFDGNLPGDGAGEFRGVVVDVLGRRHRCQDMGRRFDF